MRSLHAELCRGEHPRMSDRDFHDAVLREGAIPIELMRHAITMPRGAVALDADFTSTWRFYDTPVPALVSALDDVPVDSASVVPTAAAATSHSFRRPRL
jgi:hypothetical protein